jgi:excisionase family DNA binding protein
MAMPKRGEIPDKDIFSTFEIARLLTVDIGSVIQWINQGRLNGYRTPGGHRRVRRNDLFTFLNTYKIPIPKGLDRDRDHRIVLIVEDEVLIRMDLKRMIEELKVPLIRIEEAEDGYQAGRKIVQLKPSLVVLDVRLPGVDGFQICRDLRDLRGTDETRVIVVSGHLTAVERQEILEAGADEVLSKPVDPEEFKAKVQKYLGTHEPSPALSVRGRSK